MRLRIRPARTVAAAAMAAVLLTSVSPITPIGVIATSGGSPYSVPVVTDTNGDPSIVETTLVADETTVDIGGGVMADGYTFNGAIPGPTFSLTVGQRVIVHFQNDLEDEATGIHWHGIELDNASDGTPVTQNHVLPGDSFDYDFVVTRPGIFWYHPHHDSSTNQVFKGMYGAIVVTDPNEAELIADEVIPGPADTLVLALADLTVCKDADPNDDGDLSDSENDDDTYDDSLPWAGGGALPEQASPFPTTLCETPIDAEGDSSAGPLAEGAVPNIQKHTGRVNEGQTVLTNGVNVGGRAGSPTAPGALDAGALTYDVQPGQGLRLQIGDTATTRFFRLRLTDSAGDDIPLVRIGGEGGLLDEAVLDGTPAGGFDFKYLEGEILLDPGDRADVVIAFPDNTPAGVATLWTEDFQRTGGGDGALGWVNLPTVPVAHFNVTGAAVSPAFTIGEGTDLRSATGDPQEVLPAPTGDLLDPSLFPTIQLGMPDDIELTANGAFPSINGHQGHHDFSIDYTLQPFHESTRWALIGDVLQLNIRQRDGCRITRSTCTGSRCSR